MQPSRRTALAALLGGLLVLAALVLESVLSTVVFAITVAYVLYPLREWMASRGYSDRVAAATASAAGLLGVVALAAPLAFVLYRRRRDLLAFLATIPDRIVVELGPLFYVVETDLVFRAAQATLRDLAFGLAAAAPVIVLKLVVFAILVYGLLLKPNAPRVAALRLCPAAYHDVLFALHRRTASTLRAIYILQGATALGTFVVALGTFAALGYRSPFALAVVAGVLQFVPVLGPSVVVGTLAVVDLVAGNVFRAAIVLVVGVILVGFVPDAVIRPRLAGTTTDLPVSVYFVGFVGGCLRSAPWGSSSARSSSRCWPRRSACSRPTASRPSGDLPRSRTARATEAIRSTRAGTALLADDFAVALLPLGEAPFVEQHVLVAEMPEREVRVADPAGGVAVQQHGSIGPDAGFREDRFQPLAGFQPTRVGVDERQPVEVHRAGEVARGVLLGVAGVDDHRVLAESGVHLLEADQRRVGRLAHLVVGRRGRGRVALGLVFAAPRAVVPVEDVELPGVVAVQPRGDEKPRREHAVFVVVGDDLVIGGDTRIREQFGPAVGAGEHPGVAGARSERVERDRDGARDVSDAVVLPGVAHVDDADAGIVEAGRQPVGGDERVAHTGRLSGRHKSPPEPATSAVRPEYRQQMPIRTSVSVGDRGPAVRRIEPIDSRSPIEGNILRFGGRMAASAADTGIIRQETVPAIAMSDYAKDVLVDADWVEARLDEFQSDDPAHRLVEVDVDTEAYDSGHAPGAIGFNWETDLQDQTNRDVLTKADFEALNGGHGISEDSTVVLYGDNSNWFAAYTYWQYKYYGHDDVKLLDGGREYWVENDYPLTEEVPEFPETTYTADEPDESIRAYRGDVDEAIDAGVPLVDVRSPEEYSGEILAPPGLQETAQRGGHIPGARNISWAAVTDDDGTFKTKQELEELYADVLAEGDDEIVAYCRIGERSSVAWFALHELLGYDDTVNYDGSWTEWGNLVGAPIETGDADD